MSILDGASNIVSSRIDPSPDPVNDVDIMGSNVPGIMVALFDLKPDNIDKNKADMTIEMYNWAKQEGGKGDKEAVRFLKKLSRKLGRPELSEGFDKIYSYMRRKLAIQNLNLQLEAMEK